MGVMARTPTVSFPPATLEFLSDLRRHNNKAWFDENRSRYEADFVAPAKAFVVALAPALDALVPHIHADPKVLGSIFRINRDTRFSKDKRPYKDHLDLWFWEGERKAAVSGLFLRVSPDEVVVGAGAHGFDNHQLVRYRAAVADPQQGAELTKIVTKIERRSIEVGGETYARTPRGFTATGRADALLRHSGLYAHETHNPGFAASPTFAPGVLASWRSLVPLHRWLVDHLQI
jgi:uncharacterized protein (TIGR02453 family)